MNLIKKIIENMENTSIPISCFVFTYFSVLILRYFGESFSQSYNYLNVSSYLFLWGFIHTVCFYIAVATGLIAIFQIATRDDVEKSLRFVFSGFIIILMTPTLDLIYSPLHGANNMYMHPDMQIDILYAYLTLFGGFSGISLGLRTEIFSAVLGFLLYFRVKNLGWIKSIAYAWLSYSLIFFMAATPLLLKWIVEWAGITYSYNNDLMIYYFLFITVIFFALIYFINYVRNKTRIDFNFLCQLAFYSLLVTIGCVIAVYISSVQFTPAVRRASVGIHAFFVLISFILLSLSNIKADSIVKKTALDTKNLILVGLSVVLMAVINTKLLFMFTLFVLLDYVYFMPPYACKNIKGMAQLIAVARYTLLIAIGYVLMLMSAI